MTTAYNKEQLKQAIKAKEFDIYLEGDILQEVKKINARALITFITGAVLTIVSGIVLIAISPSSFWTIVLKTLIYLGGIALLVGLWLKTFKGYNAEFLPDGRVRVKNF